MGIKVIKEVVNDDGSLILDIRLRGALKRLVYSAAKERSLSVEDYIVYVLGEAAKDNNKEK